MRCTGGSPHRTGARPGGSVAGAPSWPPRRGSRSTRARVEILPAQDGAPDVWLDARPAPVSLSLSHRAGRALVLVGDGARPLGCDIELIEHRSDAFVRQWLASPERALVAAARDATRRDLVANLIWTGKEAAAKVRREGLRLDVRHAVVSMESRADGDWAGLQVTWPTGQVTSGWWRAEGEWVMSVAGTPVAVAPRPLEARPNSLR